MSPHPEVIGHRGWPARFPDNTLSGFLAASSVADGIELDVRRCGDGRLVVSHDPSIAGHIVHETPWAILAEADLGDGHHPALLDEVLAAIPGTPAQLEVKNWFTDPGFEPDHRIALETAQRARPGDMVTGFNPETLAAVRRDFPDVPTGLAMQAPVGLQDAIALCLDAGHIGLVPHHELLTEPLETGLRVYPWTVNDPSRALELVELGVTGIITDDPGSIIEVIGRHA